jgi:hypothetical protein
MKNEQNNTHIYGICEGPKLDALRSQSVTPTNCQYNIIHQHK